MLDENKLGRGNKNLKGKVWTVNDTKRSKEMLEISEKTLKHREKMRRLKEYVGERPNTLDLRSFDVALPVAMHQLEDLVNFKFSKHGIIMAGEIIDNLTMEQYLTLTQGNQVPGVVRPEIRGNVNFEIKSQFMQELRGDAFSGNKNDDAHEHIERVLDIISLFNIPGEFIQRYCPPSKIAKQLEDIRNFKQEGEETLYQAWERYNDLLYKCLTHDINSHQKVNIFYNGLSTMNRQLLDSHGLILGMTPTEGLIAIQTMADHSQKWHDGSPSQSVCRSNNSEGMAAIVSKLDNLGREIKKLKENVHAIQVGYQLCGKPHLDKEWPLNEEAKIMEEVKYGEGCSLPFNGTKYRVGPPGYYTRVNNRPPFGEKRPSLEELMNKHLEESAQRSSEIEEWIKKIQESTKINTRNQGASLKNLETQIEQLTKEFHAKAATEVPTSSVGQCKAVYDDAPIYNTSSNETNDIHGVSFIDVQEGDDLPSEGLPCQLPPKEINPGSFTLPFTIGSLNFYVMADLRASVNDGEPCKIITPPPHKSPLCLELDGNCNLHNRNNNTPDNDVCNGGEDIYRIDKKGKLREWYCYRDDKRRGMTREGLSFPDFLLVKYGGSQGSDLIWDNRYAEWCDKNSISSPSTSKLNTAWLDSKPKPRDYTFKKWMSIKVGHTNVNESVKRTLLKSWVIDCFEAELGPTKDPRSRSFDDYKWVFDLEIDQLADEYKEGIGKKDIF
ncbi:hypothetical protein Tco_1123347 [Tanacetum coccineum]|uniref:Retrotransposon gag domain-containing protein n=1 Tax=Tanacetum coccineum TaxID=301880 RepID=A0ABQ5J5X4_9ASTR